jgi:hypothetical protein
MWELKPFVPGSSITPPNAQSPNLFHFLVRRVLAATVAELLQLQPLRHRLPVFGGGIITFLAFTALQCNDFSGHEYSKRSFWLPASSFVFSSMPRGQPCPRHMLTAQSR